MLPPAFDSGPASTRERERERERENQKERKEEVEEEEEEEKESERSTSGSRTLGLGSPLVRSILSTPYAIPLLLTITMQMGRPYRHAVSARPAVTNR